jgi:hypothetical protein
LKIIINQIAASINFSKANATQNLAILGNLFEKRFKNDWVVGAVGNPPPVFNEDA